LAKAALGVKRTCQSCGARFYDLHRDPIICPKCATVYDPEAASRTRRSRTMVTASKAPAARPAPEVAEAPEAEVGDDDIEVAEEEGEAEEVIESTDDLPEDENEVAEVIENVDNEEN
jgi:uncharacterized protein (TIGR02300 family)